MFELLEIPFTGPVLPATILVFLVVVWSLLTTAGAIGLEEPFGLGGAWDSGLESTGLGSGAAGANGLDGVSSSLMDNLGILAVRWLNLGGVPILVWGAIFSIAWWFVSGFLWIAIDQFWFSPNLIWSVFLSIKNLILAALLTKLVTQPLKSRLTPGRVTVESLIGRECVISSTEATPDFGLVKFKTSGAPLLLNVRTDGPHLAKGTPVWITHYDHERRVYIVSPTSTKAVDGLASKLEPESKDAEL
jgi:hypothetical protein